MVRIANKLFPKGNNAPPEQKNNTVKAKRGLIIKVTIFNVTIFKV